MNYDNCDGMTYTIKQGDTLYGISRKYDVPLAMILHANPYADVYRLNVGDTICIPMKRKCCDKRNKDDRENIQFNMRNNMSADMNVSDNRTEVAENDNISSDNNFSGSNNNRVSEDMMQRADNMDLPDKTVSMSQRMTDSDSSSMSDDDNWVKYVAQPGDTLWDVFNKSKCELDEFLNKNGLKGIYILPGLVYFVKEK